MSANKGVTKPGTRSNRQRVRRYAERYQARHGGDHPTFRQASKALRLTLDEVEMAAEDAKDFGGVDILVAVGIPGVGYGAEDPRAEWLIEVYEEES